MIRVLLADDLNLVRQGVRALLAPVEDVEIAGEAATADDAARLALTVRPDVVLLDDELPGDAVQAARVIKERAPRVEIIVMADRLDESRALRVIEAGVTGYVLKDIPVSSLASALRSVCTGRAFFHPAVMRKLMERLAVLSRDDRARARLESEGLTTRELDVLMELARGSTDREIAAKLVVAEGTVKTHIHNILRKLGARNRTQAVAFVLRKGLID